MLLGNTQPKMPGDDSQYLPVGIHRVITKEAVAKRSDKKGTPFVEQHLMCPESGQGIDGSWYITPKTIEYFAGYVKALGIPQEVAATIDTSSTPTMAPMKDRYCWIKIEEEQAPNGKYYKRVTNWAPDGEKPGWAEPVPAARPAQPAAPAGGPGHAAEDDIPW